MIRNYYYLTVGILAMLFSVTHAWNGQAVVLPSLDVEAIPADTKGIFFYVWHIITAENLIFGVAFIVMSFHKDMTKVRFTAWVIAVVMIVRWIVIFGGTMLHDGSDIENTLMDSIAIAIYVTLIVLGTRIGNRQNAA